MLLLLLLLLLLSLRLCAEVLLQALLLGRQQRLHLLLLGLRSRCRLPLRERVQCLLRKHELHAERIDRCKRARSRERWRLLEGLRGEKGGSRTQAARTFMLCDASAKLPSSVCSWSSSFRACALMRALRWPGFTSAGVGLALACSDMWQMRSVNAVIDERLGNLLTWIPISGFLPVSRHVHFHSPLQLPAPALGREADASSAGCAPAPEPCLRLQGPLVVAPCS